MMPVRRSQNWLPSTFSDFFDNEWMVKANATTPAISVIETEKTYKVELAVPRMTKEDFNVCTDEENNLVISMEKKTENKEEKKDGRYLCREFSYSKFQQTMILPENVDKDHISVQAENGVLNIGLSKLSEEEVKKSDRAVEIKQAHRIRKGPLAQRGLRATPELFSLRRRSSGVLFYKVRHS